MVSKDDPLALGALIEKDAVEVVVANRNGKKESEASKQRAATQAKHEERMAEKDRAKNAAATSNAAPPPPPPPPPIDKSTLLDKIGSYRERFPELKSRNKVSAKSSADEIEDELHFIEQQLGSSNTNLSGQIFVACMGGLEYATTHHFNPLGLNLTGLGNVTRDNLADVQPILDELQIKYGWNMYMSPELRLAALVGTIMYTVHTANSGDPSTAEALRKMNQPMPKKA